METYRERIAMRAAERLAEALAKEKQTDCSSILLTVALLQAEEEIGPSPTRNPVAMPPPKICINGCPWPTSGSEKERI